MSSVAERGDALGFVGLERAEERLAPTTVAFREKAIRRSMLGLMLMLEAAWLTAFLWAAFTFV